MWRLLYATGRIAITVHHCPPITISNNRARAEEECTISVIRPRGTEAALKLVYWESKSKSLSGMWTSR